MKNKDTIWAKVDELFALYERFGDEDYIGEPISQLEHASQAAEHALKGKHDDEVVLAAFFHDLGHLLPFLSDTSAESMGGYGVYQHEAIAADYLQKMGFSNKMTTLVHLHVDAKRYLTFTHPIYYEKLSIASKKTLFHQGGLMTSEEARNFEQNPYFDLILKMRYFDELAKIPNHPLIDLENLKKMAFQHLSEELSL